MSGTIPSWLAAWTGLLRLSLADQQGAGFNGTVPSSLSALTLLTYVWLVSWMRVDSFFVLNLSFAALPAQCYQMLDFISLCCCRFAPPQHA